MSLQWKECPNLIINAEQISPHRLLIITGHFGTGKTEFSVNLALDLANAGIKTMLADLDIVNPYFRSRERKDVLPSWGRANCRLRRHQLWSIPWRKPSCRPQDRSTGRTECLSCLPSELLPALPCRAQSALKSIAPD